VVVDHEGHADIEEWSVRQRLEDLEMRVSTPDEDEMLSMLGDGGARWCGFSSAVVTD
jgi:hypothetical protein